MTAIDKPAARLLSTLRGVLFEATPDISEEVSKRVSTRPDSAELESARAALRESLSSALGPGVRELSLQMEALADALPDHRARKRAALKVLSLKGVTSAALLRELEALLGALAAQREAFANKLAQRRAAAEQRRRDAVRECEEQTRDAEQSIVRLRAELEAEQAKLVAAAEQRDLALAGCAEAEQKLTTTERGFERARAELQERYATLTRELTGEEQL
jgi:chromosome segregation ATPase